jgi:hypothetical protein
MSADEFTLDVRLGPPLASFPGGVPTSRTSPAVGTGANAAITVTNTSDRCAAARISTTIFD